MQFSTVTLLAALAPALAQLAHTVPPPVCLGTCIKQLGNCNLCNDNGNPLVQSCYQKTCGPKDVSYASAYYGSICNEGGYMNFSTTPAFFDVIPALDCAPAAAIKRALEFSA